MSAALPFHQQSRNPESHFKLHWFGAILHLRGLLPTPDGENGLGFLNGYYEELDAFGFQASGASAEARWERLLAAWESSAATHLPLRALRQSCALDGLAMTLMFTAGLVEEDVRFGQLFELLNQMPGEWRPTFGLLTMFTDDDSAREALLALLAAGLLVAGNVDAPRARWTVQVPTVLWDSMRGGDTPTIEWARHVPVADLPRPDELVLAAGTRDALGHLPRLLAGERGGLLIVRGPRGGGRRTLLRAVARSLGRGVLELSEQGGPAADAPADRRRSAVALAGPLATLMNALPVVELEPAPGETMAVPRLSSYAGPIGVVAPLRGGGVDGGDDAITLRVGVPDVACRAALWESALGVGPERARSLALRYRMPSGTIRTVAERARTECRLAGRSSPTAEDVAHAFHSQRADTLERLARRVPVAGDWGDLAVAESTARELRLLESRCRYRERLLAYVAAPLAAGLTPGVRALLTGPSGTGKTLAARLLASVLGKELYALDLSMVVNKYLGETEKNLESVLCQAEERDVVLLLDEGDALLTRRTDVQTSNDRYANLETNYLLQRLESYEGILLVTTNAGERIDAAFKRRMDVVIEFRAPDPVERWQIWRLHLPDGHEVSEELLGELASRCELKGGQIRNASLHASLLALGDDRAVGDRDVEAAVRREYIKAGSVCPLRLAEAVGG